MPRHYDAATRDLMEIDPASFLKYLGFEVHGPVAVKNCDLTSVVAESDSVLLIEEDPPWLGHVEFQTSSEIDLDLRIDRYNLLVEYREKLPVVSTVLLLRSQADSPRLTGHRIQSAPNRANYREFHYHVVRAWEQPVDSILRGPVTMLPLATLAMDAENKITAVINQVEERFSTEPDDSLVNQLRLDAMILMGLRFSKQFIQCSPWRTEKMRESTFYQGILEEGIEQGIEQGREEGAVGLFMRVATKRFGPASHDVFQIINGIHDLEIIAQLTERVTEVQTWGELLDG